MAEKNIRMRGVTMSERFSLNPDWYFKESFDERDTAGQELSIYRKIDLPHTVKELPYNCFSHDETAMRSSYVRKLTVPEECRGKRAILEFMGVMARYELYVNGQFVSEHRGGYSRSRA